MHVSLAAGSMLGVESEKPYARDPREILHDRLPVPGVAERPGSYLDAGRLAQVRGQKGDVAAQACTVHANEDCGSRDDEHLLHHRHVSLEGHTAQTWLPGERLSQQGVLVDNHSASAAPQEEASGKSASRRMCSGPTPQQPPSTVAPASTQCAAWAR